MSSKKYGRSGTGAAASSKGRGGIKRVRRRLSVVSDNKLIEGVEKLLTEQRNDQDANQTGTGDIMTAYHCVSVKGYAPYNPKKRNQDALIAHFYDNGDSMFAVFDGHGEAGDKVSGLFKKELAKETGASKYFESDPNKAMTVAYDIVEKRLLKDMSIDTQFSGTTAVSCILRGNVLTAANIGDSRLILGTETSDGTLIPTEVTIDHKPELEQEKKRILAKGGRVFAVEYDDGVDGPARVWLGHCDVPGLAMSRSLGDVVAHSAGVISTPECFQKTLSSKDKVMVLASDGLWEFLSNEDVIGIISSYRNNGDLSLDQAAQQSVDELCRISKQKWLQEEQVVDDTTIIVVFFDI